MESQITQISNILKNSNLSWWIDSGTLLSMVRDGRLFPKQQDHDVDLGAWLQQPTELARALAEFRNAGYRVGARSFQGKVCKYWLRAPWRSGMRPIDLKLYVKQGEFAICPGAVARSRWEKGSLAWYAAEVVRLPLATVWRRSFCHSWTLPLARIEFQVATWVVPAQYFEHLEYRELGGCWLPIPTPLDSYLEYRYGNWVEPRQDWVMHRDDGGLLFCSPAKAVEVWKRRNVHTVNKS